MKNNSMSLIGLEELESKDVVAYAWFGYERVRLVGEINAVVGISERNDKDEDNPKTYGERGYDLMAKWAKHLRRTADNKCVVAVEGVRGYGRQLLFVQFYDSGIFIGSAIASRESE